MKKRNEGLDKEYLNLDTPITFAELVTKITVNKTAQTGIMTSFTAYDLNAVVISK